DVDRGHRLGPGRDLLAEARVERPHLVERHLRDRTGPVRGAVDRGVVQDDEVPVRGHAQVELDLVAPLPHGPGEPAPRALGRAAHGAPVPGDAHGRTSSSYWRRTSSAIDSSRRAMDRNTSLGAALSA